jgi:hypothetical protein
MSSRRRTAVAILLGIGNGKLQYNINDPHYNFSLGANVSYAIHAAAADLDQDGCGDVITANNGSNNITVLRSRLCTSPPGGG